MMGNDAFPRPCVVYCNGETMRGYIHAFYCVNDGAVRAIVEDEHGAFMTFPIAAIQALDTYEDFIYANSRGGIML